MNDFIFKLNRKGVKELLKSEEMADIINKKAEEIKDRCGDGFEVSKYEGKNRVNASVKAETFKAKRKNAKENTILKALR